MDERRLDGLLTYLSELQRLQNSGYTCLREISECIGWIRDEFTKEPKNSVEYLVNGKVITE